MKNAYHLINFGVWKTKSEEEKIKAIADAGYKGIEGIEIDYTSEPLAVKERLEKFGLNLAAQQVPCMIMGTDDKRIAELATEQIQIGKATGCETTVIMVPRTDGIKIHTYGTTVDHYKEAGRRLNLLGRILADNGINLCIHNHIDHMTESMEEMEILMNETESRNVGICFDTAHAVCGGNDPLKYAKKFHSRIRYFHLKDTKNFLFGRPYFFKNTFLPLGKGVIDFSAIMSELYGYNGWITVELDSTFSCGDPVNEAKTSLSYLYNLLSQRLR
jgi:inosose dehydratase